MQPIFRSEKKCIRILFGDKEAYLDKFKTCARSRAYGYQELTSEFFVKEHSKPLYNKHNLMSAHNLYFYHCVMDTFKTLKFRTPISLYELFNLSKRSGKNTFLISPKQINSYICRATKIWNVVRQLLSIPAFTHKISLLKSSLPRLIHTHQTRGDPDEWEVQNDANQLCI